MLNLANCYYKIAWQLVCWLISFTNEPHLSSRFHSRFDLNFFLTIFHIGCLSITHCHSAVNIQIFGASMEEFLKCAAASQFKVFCMSVAPFCHSILMQITFNTIDHLNLLAILVEGYSVRVCCSEEDFEDLKRITIEAVALNLAFSIYIQALD